MTTIQILRDVETKLAGSSKKIESLKAFTGFDGFVDSVRKAVKQSVVPKVYYRTMSEFAQRIDDASGRSCQIEMDVQQVKMGGNAPILANALAVLGVKTLCLGCMGYPTQHPVFESLSKLCMPLTLHPPGESDAIEFEDGKLILSDLGSFNDYNWAHIAKVADLDFISKSIKDTGFVALVDWANVINAHQIWNGFLENVVIPSGRGDVQFFFDLCDPTKKSSQEIHQIVDLISKFSAYGKVTLGLNENETFRVWAALAGELRETPPLVDAARLIHNSMNIEYLLIHPMDRTIAFHGKDVIEMLGRVVARPKVQTGGGDNLNAGYALGAMLGFSLPESMIVGMAASGSYVQEGQSPALAALISYLATWRKELETPLSSRQVVELT